MSIYRYSIHFYIQTLILSWTPWLIAVFCLNGITNTTGRIMLAFGGLGPTFSTLILLFTSRDRSLRNDYFQRLNFKLISAKGMILIILIPISLAIAAIIISLPLGGNLKQFALNENIGDNLVKIIPFALFILFLGPVPEELGWRGFWLDNLRSRFTGITSSIIIAAGWALWHLPLFFLTGYPLQDLTDNGLKLLSFFINFLPLSIIHTYFYYTNRRSIIIAILLHFMINFTGTIIEISLISELIQNILYLALAIFIVRKNAVIFQKKLS